MLDDSYAANDTITASRDYQRVIALIATPQAVFQHPLQFCICLTHRTTPRDKSQGTSINKMAQSDISGFKTVADKAAYEADYAERAKHHQEEEAS